MEEIIIRLATISDVPALAKLRLSLRSIPGQNIETEQAFIERCEAWMSNAMGEQAWRCWVAENNDILIGTLWLQLVNKIPNPTVERETLAYITSFFIDESVRNQGLGSRILTTALNWCRKQNVETVVLWPTHKSRTLYQRHGFAVSESLFALTLNPDSERGM